MCQPRFTLLSLAVVILAAGGCRQTNGTTVGSLTNMGGLTPVASGQNPVLGSFGSTTRVTPPPTGSFSPNANLGTTSPAPGYGPGYAPATNFAPQPNTGAFNQSIGSGVQPVSGFNQPAINQHANWTETGTTLPADRSNQDRDPRASGMQVIDLTGAANQAAYQRGTYTPGTYQAPQFNSTASRIISPSLIPAQPVYQNTQPVYHNTQQVFQPAQPAFQALQPSVPSAFQAQSSAPFPTTSPQFENRSSAASLPAASTATLPEHANDNSLNWRRPGTQF